MTTRTPQAHGEPTITRQTWINIYIALYAGTIAFWAWAVLSPLGPRFKEDLGLSAVQTSALVAVPVIVGSLGRIPIGWLAAKFGPRKLWAITMVATAVPTFLLAFAQDSYVLLLVLGFFIGTGGATYAIGIYQSDTQFPPKRRGFSQGLYSLCDIGVAISGFTVLRIVEAWGASSVFFLITGFLLVGAVLSWVLMRDLPGTPPPSAGMWTSFSEAIRRRPVLEQSWLYALTFGVYVALGVYAVVFFKGAYDVAPTTASLFMASLILLASLMRPVGGWLADRVGPIRILVAGFAVDTAAAVVISFTPALGVTLACFALITLSAGLGASAVYGLVPVTTPSAKYGTTGGIVGALGGMGGYFPPLVLGAIFDATGSYQWGLLLLAIAAALTGVYTALVVPRTMRRYRVSS